MNSDENPEDDAAECPAMGTGILAGLISLMNIYINVKVKFHSSCYDKLTKARFFFQLNLV